MLIISFLWTIIEWGLGIITYSAVIWLLPLIIALVILSVMGVKIRQLGSATFKTVKKAALGSITWVVERIPAGINLIKKFYLFLSKRCFGMLPSGVAKVLAIVIIVII